MTTSVKVAGASSKPAKALGTTVFKAQMAKLWIEQKLNLVHVLAITLLLAGVFILDHYWFFIAPFITILAAINLGLIFIPVSLYLLVWRRS